MTGLLYKKIVVISFLSCVAEFVFVFLRPWNGSSDIQRFDVLPKSYVWLTFSIHILTWEASETSESTSTVSCTSTLTLSRVVYCTFSGHNLGAVHEKFSWRWAPSDLDAEPCAMQLVCDVYTMTTTLAKGIGKTARANTGWGEGGGVSRKVCLQCFLWKKGLLHDICLGGGLRVLLFYPSTDRI